MKRLVWLLAVVVAVLAWRDWTRREIVHPPGVLVPESPVQTPLEARTAPIAIDGFRLTPRAQFRVRARVLSREDYRWGAEAKLSPTDLALGWGVMSDQAVLDRIDVTQGSRWYFTRYERPAPLPDHAIIRHSGNMHVVPADELVRRTLREVRRGDVVEARGYLVDVDHESGFRWRTSLVRDDTGNGSCEIFYVERIFIEPRS